MSKRKLQASRIRIRNFVGIEDLEIEPGAVTVLEGRNGSGKSSTLNAIRATIGGGHDATMIREGAEFGEVVIVFDDGMSVRNRLTKKGSRLTVKDPDGNTVKGPQRYLNAIRDALSLNPVDFVEARPRERLELLAGAVPAQYGRDTIEKAAGIELPPHVLLTGGALEMLGTAESWYYDTRREANVSLRQAKETLDSLRSSLPSEGVDPDSVQEELRELRERRDAEIEAREDRINEAEAVCQQGLSSAAEDFDTARTAAAEERDSAIEKARREFETLCQKARDEFESSMGRASQVFETRKQKAEKERDAAISETRNAWDTRVGQIGEQIATFEERLVSLQKAAGTREVFEKTERKAKELEQRHEKLDRAVEAVRELRTKLLADLPIQGLEVRDGDIWFEGVPWRNLEESRRVWLAVQVAQMRAGELGLICVDGLERLDHRTFDLFADALLASGAQLIGARVTDGELAVTYPGEDD